LEKWPKFDETKLVSSKAKIVVQINGKFRATIEVASDSLQDVVEKEALKNELVVKWLENQKIIQKIFIKNRIINFVVVSQ
jgi:leucyl-tRNA synthetase